MTARDTHLQQARANRAFARELLAQGRESGSETHLQWAITAAFYCAVHCMEAYFARDGLHSVHHQDRARNMDACGVPDVVYRLYRKMEERSRDVRYECGSFSAEYVEQTVLSRYLDPITRWVGLDVEA